MTGPIIQVSCDFTYEAAHWLPKVADTHQCHRLHGHSYQLTVTLAGPIDDNGMVEDFADIKDTVRRNIIDKLDHQTLNDIIDNPTVENQLLWIAAQLKHSIAPRRLTLRETATNRATLEIR